MSVKPTVLKRPENDVTERNATDRNVATLETAPTRYVEGGGIRFAYRQLGRRPERRWFCCSISRATSTRGIPPS
jgi:hypothetical protein